MSFANKVGVIVCAAAAMSSCSYPGSIEPFDESKVVLMQLTEMREGEDIGVISTSQGEIVIRFFPSEAPKSVENFIALAQQGYYDGQAVYSAAQEDEQSGCFFAGSADGERGETIFRGESFEAEISYNLCPFAGAVSMKTDNRGRADSRFFINTSSAVSAETARKLDDEGFPKLVADAFAALGGYPDRWLNDAVFAQVIEGQEVVDSIADLVLEGEEVIIEKITIEQYDTSR